MEKFPFDASITNIEDRVWGEEVILNGYEIIYEPTASVFHYHGIHQDGNPERLRNVVRIIEDLELKKGNDIKNKTVSKKVCALIPVLGEITYLRNKPLIEYTIEKVNESKLIDKVIVTSDNKELIEFSKKEDLKLI